MPRTKAKPTRCFAKSSGVKKTFKDHNKEEESPSPSSPNPPPCMKVVSLPKDLVCDFAENQEKFELLWNEKPSQRGTVKIYGKEIDVPRYQQSYLKDYSFSGVDHRSVKKLPEVVSSLWEWAQESEYARDGKFNQALINWYENGNSYIGAHSDDESQLVENSAIISISLGATRKFRIRSKEQKDYRYDVDLEGGTAVIMMDDMQKKYKHEIVKISGEKGKSVGRRINLTFRKFK